MKIFEKPLDWLKPYENNPRNNDSAVEPVANSIREFGFKVPIVATSDGEIINGHTRLKAAKLLGLKNVPVIIADDLTDEQVKAFRLADNKTSEIAEWNFELLLGELSEIQGLDMTMFGFEDEDYQLDDIREDDNHELEPDQEETEVRESFVKHGDIFQLGRHRLMCGDSTNAEDMAKLIEGATIDLYVTDPPYNVSYEGGTEEAMTIMNDSMDDASFRQFLRDAFKAANAFLKPGGAFYIWHADVVPFAVAVKETGWLLKQNLIWVKNAIVLGRQDYQWKHEPCLYGWKDGASHYFVDNRSLSTVIEEDEENLKEMSKSELIAYIKTMQENSPTTIFYEDKPLRNDIHPTMKPLKLIARCVLNSSKKGERVLDSFNGGGSTLMVCEQTERICYAMELDPVYVERTIRRWEEATGQTAVLVE